MCFGTAASLRRCAANLRQWFRALGPLSLLPLSSLKFKKSAREPPPPGINSPTADRLVQMQKGVFSPSVLPAGKCNLLRRNHAPRGVSSAQGRRFRYPKPISTPPDTTGRLRSSLSVIYRRCLVGKPPRGDPRSLTVGGGLGERNFGNLKVLRAIPSD